MKKIYILLIALSLIFGKAVAQDVMSSSLKIPASYDRSSITLLVLDYPGEKHYEFVRNNVDKVVFNEKYYINKLDFLTIKSPYKKDLISLNKKDLILEQLKKDRVGNEIVAKWYSMNKEGLMSLDLVHSRGMFNATDETFLQAKTTKRGNSQLEDYGNRLIDRSYILVFDFHDIKTMEEAKIKDYKGWKSNVNAYLYKIDYNEAVRNAVYDNWIYEDDNAQVKAAKKAAFAKLEIPMVFVSTTPMSIDKSESTKDKNAKLKTDDQLMAETIQHAYEEILYSMEMRVEDFKVITTIHATKPLRAKIGKKEGLKTDNRFFAYEYVYNERKNETKQVLRGVIRSTSKIADNVKVSEGKSPTSQFYQVSGRGLETGYLLQQKNDGGGELSIGIESGEIGGIYGRLDVRLGRFVGVQALFVYLEGGYQSKEYNNISTNFLRYGIGLAKGLQLTRNAELRPFLGAGFEDSDADSHKHSTMYYKGGATLAYNIKYNIQLVGSAGYYITTKLKDSEGNDTGMKWNEKYDGRSGLSIMGGVKIGF